MTFESTVTFGEIETRIRRDLLNDNDAPYRWSVACAMSCMNAMVKDIPQRHNSWAGYDDSGKRIYQLNTDRITETCDNTFTNPDVDDQTATELRAIVVPISGRYLEAVAYLAAAKMLELDDTDTSNLERSQRFYEQGREYAQR